jgi:hypothetical protein
MMKTEDWCTEVWIEIRDEIIRQQTMGGLLIREFLLYRYREL